MLSVNTVYAGAYNVDVQEYLDELLRKRIDHRRGVREEDTGQDVYVADGVDAPSLPSRGADRRKKVPGRQVMAGNFFWVLPYSLK